MGRILLLGSANAVPSETMENTHLLVESEDRTVLVDCASNPIQHLRKAGVEFDCIDDIILTHFHPDHVSGAPLLLMGMWLLGRKKPINIHGIPHTLDRMVTMMEMFDWGTWPNFYPVNFHRLPEEELSPVIESASLRIFSSPVKHLIPTIGLRIEFPNAKKSAAYSCDTEPSPNVVRLAAGVDVLIHESAGASTGHSSPAQAATIASQAGAKVLYLIHYPTVESGFNSMLENARQNFNGQVYLGRDLMSLDFN